ncbi:MAG: class I SAM-dependent methyltransferase [Chloroflexota bacterium]|nr:MAG: class I SAM-dependent methyltransferase [Chloroflexota bacterium]
MRSPCDHRVEWFLSMLAETPIAAPRTEERFTALVKTQLRRLRAAAARSWLNPYTLTNRRLTALLGEMAPRAHGKMLDVGCGKKPYASLFSQVEAHIGVEVPITLSKSQVIDVYGSALHLPFASSSFDTVLCTQVLEHVPEPHQLLGEVARVLKPGGILILTAPQTWGPHEVPHDFFRFTRFGLSYLAGCAGLQVETIKPTTGTFGMVGQRLSTLLYHKLGQGRFLCQMPTMLLCASVQLVCEGLDRLVARDGDTLDHVMVAIKVPSPDGNHGPQPAPR